MDKMSTEVKEAPAKRKSRTKSKNDAPPVDETAVAEAAGGQDSTTSETETDVDRLAARLKSFGFDVPLALIGQWDGPTFTQIELTASRWQDEFDRANNGEAIPEADRTPVPAVLLAQESVTPDLQKLAQDNAIVAAKADQTVGSNLYPPASALAKIWLTAFEEAKGEAPAAAKNDQPTGGNATNAAELNAKREADAKADKDRQQQLAIEAAQRDMEDAVTHQEELAEQIVDMKAEMKELKSAYDNAVVRGQKAAKALRRARAGIFERTLPFPRDAKRDDSLDVPDQDVDGQGRSAAAAAKPTPKVDEGAFVYLDHLVKGELQAYIPGTPEDRGLSEKQVEKLKEAIGGDTIGKLEEFQRSKGEWWTREINGFGKETITKLQEAHEIVRRKFPIPEPGEVQEAATETTPATVTLTTDEALERLAALVEKCESIAETCESDDGVEFLTSVGEQASSMQETIEEHENVTADQSRAIVNWEAGVAKWDKGEPIGAADDDEEELEVPDADEGEDDA